MSDKHGVPDTGHVWDDDLRELTNPPPKWWIIGFHASWLLVFVYGLLYPMWPTLHGHTKGLLGWTSIKEFHQSEAAIDKVRDKYQEMVKGMTAKQILANPNSDAYRYAVDAGRVLFGDNCAACHGANGSGNPGFPVLADDDWLYGGTIGDIVTTITGGRHGSMPARGLLHNLTDQEIKQVANYVYNDLSKGKPDADVPGRAIFHGKGMCFTCHGANGKGNQAIGSANLTDSIWRFIPDGHHSKTQLGSVIYTITHGVNQANVKGSRVAVMPVWSKRLSPTEIKELAVYVFQLGGGQPG